MSSWGACCLISSDRSERRLVTESRNVPSFMWHVSSDISFNKVPHFSLSSVLGVVRMVSEGAAGDRHLSGLEVQLSLSLD